VVREITFQFVNFYFSLFYVAFGKWGHLGVFPKSVFEERNIPPGSRMPDLQVQLMLVFTAKLYGKQVANFFKPFVLAVIKKVMSADTGAAAAASADDGEDDAESETKSASKSDPVVPWISLQMFLEEYNAPGKPTCYDDWVEMVIQFGFLVLFSPAFPLGPLLVWFNVIVETRLDATALCRAHQRPRWESTENIGTWEGILTFLTVMGVMTNAVITFFVSVQTADFFDIDIRTDDGAVGGIVERAQNHNLWLLCLGMEHLVFFGRVVLQLAIPDEKEWIWRSKASVELAIENGELQTYAEREERETTAIEMESSLAMVGMHDGQRAGMHAAMLGQLRARHEPAEGDNPLME